MNSLRLILSKFHYFPRKPDKNEPLIPDEIEESKLGVKIDSICMLKLVIL
jgi:hypothetical protein